MPKAVSSSHPVAFPTSMAFCTAAISPVTPATNSFIIKRLWLGVPYHTISTGAAFTALSTAAIPTPAGAAPTTPKALPTGVPKIS